MKPAKNISESVRQRILNKSKADKRPFNHGDVVFSLEHAPKIVR